MKQITKKVIFSQSSSDALAKVLKECETFKPTTITCFFNNSNFIFSKYMIPVECVNMILENDEGDLIFTDNLSCGNTGIETSMTAQLLEFLGVEREDAQKYSLMKGFSVKFLEERCVCEHLDGFFVWCDGNSNEKFEITKYDRVNLITRKVYMVDPQLHNVSSFFNALEIMQPVSIEYCIRKNVSIENDIVLRDFQLYHNSDVISNYRNQHINLIVRGNVFNLLCFVDYKCIKSFASTVYNLLFGRTFEGKGNVKSVIARL